MQDIFFPGGPPPTLRWFCQKTSMPRSFYWHRITAWAFAAAPSVTYLLMKPLSAGSHFIRMLRNYGKISICFTPFRIPTSPNIPWRWFCLFYSVISRRLNSFPLYSASATSIKWRKASTLCSIPTPCWWSARIFHITCLMPTQRQKTLKPLR